MTIEFNGENELDARQTAMERISEVDKDDTYTIEDFSVVSVDETIISKDKTYTTRDGRKITLLNDNRETKSSHIVDGHIHTVSKSGSIKKEWNTWSVNGRNLAVGTSEKDLVEV